jgi:hypothetical protein
MFIICNIKSIKEWSLTYHPGGISEISRGLREAIPPDSSASTSLIPEGLHKINVLMKYPVSSLRDEREAGVSRSGGIASLNPRLISVIPPGFKKSIYSYRYG